MYEHASFPQLFTLYLRPGQDENCMSPKPFGGRWVMTKRLGNGAKTSGQTVKESRVEIRLWQQLLSSPTLVTQNLHKSVDQHFVRFVLWLLIMTLTKNLSV